MRVRYRRRTLGAVTLPSVTVRERLALTLVLLGACSLIVAATGWGGWVAGVGTAGGLMLGGGVLLGLDDSGSVDAGELAGDPDDGVVEPGRFQ